MRKWFEHITRSAIIATLGIIMAAGSAMAIPITGTINFTGGLQLLPIGSTEASATGIQFVAGEVSYGGEGTFASIPVFTPVTFTTFTFVPNGAVAVTPLWTLSYAGNTYSFDLTNINSYLNGAPNTLSLAGLGILKATGFDDTVGTWTLTTQGLTQILSFSATSTVPEPGTILLLGAGLLGLGLYRKRRA